MIKNTLKQTKFEDKTAKSTQLSLVLIGLHDFLPICSVSVFFDRIGSQISPPRAKKDSNIPSPGRTRSVKCPTPGLTKTIKSPPHALSPPPAGITLIGAFSALGFKCYYRWTFNLLHLGPVITLVPSTSSTDKKSGSLIRIWSKTQPNI